MHVLVIEDNETMREGMVQILSKMNLQVQQARDGESGLAHIQSHSCHLVITDYRMSGMDGLEVLQKVKELSPATEVMIITAYGSIDLAVQAMHHGAADFITKPFSHEEFKIRVGKIAQKIEQAETLDRLSDENVYLRAEIEQQFNFGEIIGESAKMQDLYRTIAKVARTDSSVIIYGESGTGKELVARAIHKTGDRSQNPFIRVNCGVLAEGVLESELFGHEKGAFTGALRRKRGRFELAHQGTLFLDEIGDIPLATQVKLLRVLQEKEFERVGGEETLTVSVRVLAATNRDLRSLVQENKFREDLYYRLHIIPIYLPPLRDRAQDIPQLAQHVLRRIGAQIGRSRLMLSPEALQALCRYHWPGNVRELENVLERAAVLAKSETIQPRDLPMHEQNPLLQEEETGLPLDRYLARVEERAIRAALESAGGVKSKAARQLGVKISTLYYKMEKFHLA